ncbi:MAG: peptide deformylase [Candidatus Veblenbacteria bacterium]|nr:peptide deformylase [Candidatus Veblenbacteria bacterium]MDZ4230172.1 peptide deformylase [Candidatus Veblenbacteria bacterium]
MLPLVLVPQPILRQVAKPVELPITEEVQRLGRDMIEAMVHYHGIGLAAPQVNQGVRLIVIATVSGPTVCVNPEIVKSSWRKVNFEEGCLSIPNVFGLVRRPERVLVHYCNLQGEEREEWLVELAARVYQHEVDHLNGVLFVDRASKITAGRELLKDYGLV